MSLYRLCNLDLVRARLPPSCSLLNARPFVSPSRALLSMRAAMMFFNDFFCDALCLSRPLQRLHKRI